MGGFRPYDDVRLLSGGNSANLIFNDRTCHMVELKLTVTAHTSADRLRPYPSGTEDIMGAG